MSPAQRAMYALVKYADRMYNGETAVVSVKDISEKLSDGKRVAFEPTELTSFQKDKYYIYSTDERSKEPGRVNSYYVYIGRMAGKFQ